VCARILYYKDRTEPLLDATTVFCPMGESAPSGGIAAIAGVAVNRYKNVLNNVVIHSNMELTKQ
jgi:hypothetical protein